MSGLLPIGTTVHANAAWLGEDLTGVADEALTAFEEGSAHLSASKAGAFLEGLLCRLLDGWGTPREPQAGLGQLIGALRRSEKAPPALLDRLGEANAIRVRASHVKSDPLDRVTDGDALQILSILGLAVGWAVAQGPKGTAGAPLPAPLPIFLSVGGPHRLDQEQFLRRLRSHLRGLGVDLRSLSGGYSEERPFDQVRELMTGCRAALVVGLDRSHAYTVFERERSPRERVYPDQYVPTAWNQIEGAIASALRLPLLVLREGRLHAEGIFDTDSHRHRIRPFDLRVESRGISPDLSAFLAGWVEEVRATAPDAAPSADRP